MSTSILRLVSRTDGGDEFSLPRSREQVQLCLFDIQPVRRMLCLPMAEIHGTVFSRAVAVSRPWLVVDLRAYPYFDLPSLSRRGALQILEQTPARYLHCPLDLRPPKDQAARWQLRQTADNAFSSFAASFITNERPVLVLVGHIDEIETLDEALRGSSAHREMPWMVEPHGVMSAARRA